MRNLDDDLVLLLEFMFVLVRQNIIEHIKECLCTSCLHSSICKVLQMMTKWMDKINSFSQTDKAIMGGWRFKNYLGVWIVM